MKSILKIAQNELRSLFYSPIAWLVLIAFFFQAAGNFFISFTDQARFMDHVLSYNPSGTLYSLTSQLFAGFNRVFPNLLSYVELYVPLLTMSLMSREYSSGSIKLLYSSPIKDSQIILGKYLAIVSYCFIMVSTLFIFLVVGNVYVETLDISWVLTSILGIFLLVCTYSSIGLFMSCLTSYQIVSAILTFIILSLLSTMRFYWQDIPFFNEITYWLCIKGRAQDFIAGIISSESLLYFIIVSGLFLSFAIINMNCKRQKIAFKFSFVRYLSVILVVCALGYITSRPSFRLFHDSTYTKGNSITKESQAVVNAIKGELSVTNFVKLKGARASYFYPNRVVEDKNRLINYTRFKPDMTFKTYYFSDDVKQKTEQEFKSGRETYSLEVYPTSEIRKIYSDLDQEKDAAFKLFETVDGKRSVLRTYDGPQPLPKEPQITAALRRLTTNPIKIGVINGHREREYSVSGERTLAINFNNKYSPISLVNLGFDFQDISLNKEVAKDINILLIADPKESFSDNELQYLQKYIDKGGNLFITSNNNRGKIINPILNKIGVNLNEGTIAKKNIKETPDYITSSYLPNDVIKLPSINMRGCAPLAFDPDSEFKITPICYTNSMFGYWNELQTTDFFTDEIIYNPKTGENKTEFMTAFAVSRKLEGKEQRILAFGDTEVFTDQMYSRDTYPFMQQCFNWLTEGRAPLVLTRKAGIDRKMNITEKKAKVLSNSIKWGLSICLLLLGSCILIRRKVR